MCVALRPVRVCPPSQCARQGSVRTVALPRVAVAAREPSRALWRSLPNWRFRGLFHPVPPLCDRPDHVCRVPVFERVGCHCVPVPSSGLAETVVFGVPGVSLVASRMVVTLRLEREPMRPCWPSIDFWRRSYSFGRGFRRPCVALSSRCFLRCTHAPGGNASCER